MAVDTLSTTPTVPRKATPSARPETAKPPLDWWIEIADRDSLPNHHAAWDALAKNAVEPNVFYEPWMLLPALQSYEGDRKVRCILIYRRDGRPKQPPQLCGFFPFVHQGVTKGMPVASLQLWQHHNLNLCTPLIHRDWTRESFGHLIDWARNEARYALLDLPVIHGEGPIQQALLDVMRERRLLYHVDDCYTRALIRRGADAESYCVEAMNHLSRKEWRRQRKRLAELGKLETRILGLTDDASPLIEQFLDLEASGWKGKENTALSLNDTDRQYFRTIANAAQARGQLHMLGLFLDGRPIALKCNFLSGDGGVAFKIAFDEQYAKFSPGVQLELDNIDEVHRRPGLHWLDSNAIPGHFMINRLWKEKRVIQRILIATGRRTGIAVVGLLPMLRSAKRLLFS